MAGSNSTLLPYPRSKVTPELWIPYVLIGASCVTFLAVHFYCYHKRNRIRYLRKRDESRVKTGLLERRRITTLIMSRYQAELEMTPTDQSGHPAVDNSWETARPSLSHNRTVSLEDNVEVVMDGALTAAARQDVSSLAVDKAWRTSSSLSTVEHTSKDYRPIDVFTLENTDMLHRLKDSANQTDQQYRNESGKMMNGTSGHSSSTNNQGGGTTNIDPGKPEVIGIFNISQRYAWNENSFHLEDINDTGRKRKYYAQGFNSEMASQPHTDQYFVKCGTRNNSTAKHPQPVNGITQDDNGEITSDSTRRLQKTQTHKAQSCGNNTDQLDTAEDITDSSIQIGFTGANRKEEIFRAPSSKPDTPPSSISSPVSPSTVFKFHDDEPYQDSLAVRQPLAHLAPDLEDSPATNGLVMDISCPTAFSRIVSVDAGTNTPTPKMKQEAGYTKGSQTMLTHSSGASPQTHAYAPCAQTDDEDSVSDGSPKKTFKNHKAHLPQTQLLRQISVDSPKAHRTEDGIFNADVKEVTPVTECSSDPPSYDEIVACLSPPGSSSGQRQSLALGNPPEGHTDHRDIAEPGMLETPFHESGQQKMSSNLDPKLIFQHKRRKRGKD